MALAILDGTQTATTLSTILSSGQHITAHTVVSLGTQAITDILNATSAGLTNTQLRASAVTIGGTVTVGNSLTISSLPAISGTVTAGNLPISPFAGVNAQLVDDESQCIGIDVPFRVSSWNNDNIPISGVVTVSNIQTVTAGSSLINTTKYPAAFVGYDGTNGDWQAVPLSEDGDSVIVGNSFGAFGTSNLLPISGTVTVGNTVTIAGTVTANPTGTQTIAGSVTIGAGTAQIGSVTASISNSVTIGSLPLIAGTVTANLRSDLYDTPNDQYLNRSALHIFNGDWNYPVGEGNPLPISGSVTIGAGTAQIGSVTASISNSVTIASLPAISGTVTANTFAIQGTAVTTSNFTSTTASTVLANYNATREVLTIFNEGAGNLHICAGATCTTIAYQVRLSSGDYYEVPNHQTTITHSAVFATAGTARIVQIS